MSKYGDGREEQKQHLALVERSIAQARRDGDRRLLRNLQRERRRIREALGFKREK